VSNLNFGPPVPESAGMPAAPPAAVPAPPPAAVPAPVVALPPLCSEPPLPPSAPAPWLTAPQASANQPINPSRANFGYGRNARRTTVIWRCHAPADQNPSRNHWVAWSRWLMRSKALATRSRNRCAFGGYRCRLPSRHHFGSFGSSSFLPQSSEPKNATTSSISVSVSCLSLKSGVRFLFLSPPDSMKWTASLRVLT